MGSHTHRMQIRRFNFDLSKKKTDERLRPCSRCWNRCFPLPFWKNENLLSGHLSLSSYWANGLTFFQFESGNATCDNPLPNPNAPRIFFSFSFLSMQNFLSEREALEITVPSVQLPQKSQDGGKIDSQSNVCPDTPSHVAWVWNK